LSSLITKDTRWVWIKQIVRQLNTTQHRKDEMIHLCMHSLYVHIRLIRVKQDSYSIRKEGKK